MRYTAKLSSLIYVRPKALQFETRRRVCCDNGVFPISLSEETIHKASENYLTVLSAAV